MYAECCGYILMSASALCIHVGMSACFGRPFVRQSVSSARLSVRLMIVYHCACRYIFRPSICLIFRLSACLFTCTYVETNVLVCVLLSSKIDLSLHWTLISFVFFLFCFFRVVVQTTALPVCAPFYAKTMFTIAKKVPLYL